MYIGAATMENSMSVLKKLNMTQTYDLAIPPWEFAEDKNFDSKRYIHLYISLLLFTVAKIWETTY